MNQMVPKFLTLLNVPISGGYVDKLLQAHPDFPSLLSISDVLKRLGINHAVTRVTKDDLKELPYPYLLTFDNGYGRILLIKNGKDLNKYESEMERGGSVVLIVEPSARVNDDANNDLYRVERKVKRSAIVGISAFAGILLLTFLNSTSSFLSILLVTAILGSVVGFLLVTKDLGIIFEAIDRFCNAGKKTSCDAVLKADVTIFGVPLPDAVLAYFFFQIVALGVACTLPDLAQLVLVVIGYLSAMALPIILFSLYYQYFVARKWCRLCIAVDGILLLQTSLLGYRLDASIVASFATNLNVLVMFVLVAVIILSVVVIGKTSTEKFEKMRRRAVSADQVKHNVSIFNFLLSRQRVIDTKAFEPEMKLGNVNAPINIIVATDFYCLSCKKKHEIVAQLLANYSEEISMTFRFVKSGNDEEYKTESLKPLLGYWHQHIQDKINEGENTATFLHDWFTIWNFEKFRKKYPNHIKDEDEKSDVDRLIASHYAWADESTIIRTPTFFINGFEMPREYEIDDLLAFVPVLAEEIRRSLRNENEFQNQKEIVRPNKGVLMNLHSAT